MTPDDDLLTLAEAADLTGRNPNTVQGWAARGDPPAAGRKRGRGGMWSAAFRRADVLRLDAARPRCPHRDEPTAAEVEAMVAEQMANLPAWWPKVGPDVDPDGDEDEPAAKASTHTARKEAA